MNRCIWLLLLSLSGLAHASGAGDPEDSFVSRFATDVPLVRYDRGELGVVLPSYGRVYLYPAWRAIVLGREGLAASPATPGGLRAAVGQQVDGWLDSKDDPFAKWAAASGKHLQRVPVAGMPPYRSLWRSKGYSYTYLNCPASAFDHATATLATLEKRSDAQAQRLRDWVQAQDQVFDACDYDPTAKPQPGKPARPEPVVPQALGAGEPLYWRQLRDYQRAASQFYNEQYAQAGAAFERIGATAGHPMQPWGAYLALRTLMRQASLEQVEREERRAKGGKGDDAPWATQTLAAITARADRILADRQLAPVHEAVRASLRAAQFRLVPAQRLQALSDWLDDPRHDPYRDSALGDWRRLAAQSVEFGSGYATLEPALRKRHAYFDWMRSLQRCVFDDGKTALAQACTTERAHALERWQATTGGERRAWLVAALTLAQSLTPALEAAAQQVGPTAPESLSVRYQLARLYRLAGKPDRTREIAGAALQLPQLAKLQSDSAHFMFQQERFATASSRDDAVGFIQRKALWQRDPDTGEAVPRKDAGELLAADGLAWLNTRVSTADLLAIGRDKRLAANIRAGIVAAAWLRADLLGQVKLAADAAAEAQVFGGLRDAAGAYLAAAPAQRRHVLLLSAVRLNLTPEVHATNTYLEPAKPPAEAEEQPTAGMWCHLGAPADAKDDPWNTSVEQVPPPPDLASDAAARDKELTGLRNLKTATGYFGEHVLAHARNQPQDPELPWLLHVVVQSTKGGCVDADNSRLSHTAWQLLHSRYKDSPWARRTPYWY